MSCYQWIGMGVSVIMTVCCGIASSFPVYAVKLKTSFTLNQSQVELVASFVVMGWSFEILTAWVIKRFGYQACYILVLFLTASTSLLMWAATYYVPFFRENIWLMCLFQFLNTAGTSGGFQCVSAISTEHFSKKHTGKVIGVYMAAFGFGKFYYALLFDIFFERQETLRHFFLTLAISLSSLVVLCSFVHRQPTREDSNSEKFDVLSDFNKKLSPETMVNAKSEKRIECPVSHGDNLLTSWYFYLMGGSYILTVTGTNTFMNNVTSVGAAVGIIKPLNLVYILSIGMVTSRLTFGALYDYFGSLRSGFTLLYIQGLAFTCSILICLFWLDRSTVYFMVFLASIGCGAGYFLPLAMLVSEFGIPSYPIIIGIVDLVYVPSILSSHITAGWTYDYAANLTQTTDLFCKECFNGTYIMALSLIVVVFILQTVTAALCYVKLRR